MRRPRGSVRIGGGAGYAGDRIEGAVNLAERGALDYLVLECLAERTIALAHARRARDAALGYDALLQARMEALLPVCFGGGGRVKMISNMGAANPIGAMEATLEIADSLGLTGLEVAAVEGDDVLDRLEGLERQVWESGEPLGEILGEVRWAHAYLGADALLPALQRGSDIVLGGRIADPSLFVAPIAHEFGWPLDDWHLLGRATVVGHLLECGAAVCGGYFADPGRPEKAVPHLDDIGMPIAEVAPDGACVITKTPASGGRVAVETCREQLLYEIHDPARYLTPDVTADFSGVALHERAEDEVEVLGATGGSRPEELKVIMGVDGGFIGEGEISYAGPGALGRARLAASVVEERLRRQGVTFSQWRTEYIGYDSMLGPIAERSGAVEPFEVRLRLAGRSRSMRDALRLGEELEALALTGPAGGGGKRSSARAVEMVRSTSMPRSLVTTSITTGRS